MSPMQQLLIVAGVLISLPLAVKLLWKLHLFPLGFWIAATRLFWPKWAEETGVLSLALLAASILFFLGAWWLRYRLKKRREKEWLAQALATGRVLEYGPANPFPDETD